MPHKNRAVRSTARLLSPVAAAGKVSRAKRKFKKQMESVLHPHRKEVVTMKKSTFVSLLVVLAAIVGALTAAFLYLRRREAELDEYEQLLFSEDFSHEAKGSAPACEDGAAEK